MILYGIVVFIHVCVAIVLILVILLQAGRGGGLSEAFGGSSTQTIFGTKASTFLIRTTAVCAIVYLLTCLTLAVMTARRGRSLMERQRLEAPRIPEVPGVPIGPGAQVPPEVPPVPSATPVTEPEARPPLESEPLTLPEE